MVAFALTTVHGLRRLSLAFLLAQLRSTAEQVFPRTVAYAPGKANSSVYGVVVLVGDSALDGTASTGGSVESTLASLLGTTVINNAVAGANLDDVYNMQPACSCYSQCKWSVVTAGMNRNTGGSRTMSMFIAREIAAGKQVVIQGHPTPLQGTPLHFMALMDSYAALANGKANVWFNDPRTQEFWKFPGDLSSTVVLAGATEYYADDRFNPSPLGGRELAKSIATSIQTNRVIALEKAHTSSSGAHCTHAHGAGRIVQAHNLRLYADRYCQTLVDSIRVDRDFCKQNKLQCMGPLPFFNSDGVMQKQTSLRYRVEQLKANVSRFDMELYWNAGCHGELGANFKTGSTLDTKKLFQLECAEAFEYPTADVVYLRWESLPEDCSSYFGDLMMGTTTTTTTTTTTLSRGECAFEDAFLHPFRMLVGQLGRHGVHEKMGQPALGAFLNFPMGIALDSMKQIKHEQPVKKFSTRLPAHGAVVMPLKPSQTPYGPQVASYGMVVMPPAPAVLPPELQTTPDAALVMPDGSVDDPQPFVMVPGDVKPPGPETLSYAAVLLPPSSPGPADATYGSVTFPPGTPVTPPGAQIVSWGAELKPAGLPEMPGWAHVSPPEFSYGPPNIDGGATFANLVLPGTKPIPLASVVEPGVPVVLPQPYDARAKPRGAQQVFVADSGNHAVRLVNLTTGVMTTVAGLVGKPGSAGDGGPATSAYLLNPRAVAVDVTARILYVADFGNHVIRRVGLANGIIRTIAGVMQSPGSSEKEGSALSVRLKFPMGLALDAAGSHLYIADSENHVIRLLDIGLQKMSTIAGALGVRGQFGGGSHAIEAHFSTPSHLALDEASKKLYISDHYNHAVRCLDLASGSLVTVAGVLGLRGNTGDGAPDGFATSTKLSHPTGLALDLVAQVLYIAESSNHAVRQLDLTSGGRLERTMYTFSSRPGFLGTAAEGGPLGLAFDPITKEVYVVEAFNDAVQVVDVTAEVPNTDVSCRTDRERPVMDQ